MACSITASPVTSLPRRVRRVAWRQFAAPGRRRERLLVVLNHAGDVLSAKLAMEMALREAAKSKWCSHTRIWQVAQTLRIGGDWSASFPFTRWPVRRQNRAHRWLHASRLRCAWNGICVPWRSLFDTATHPSTGQPIFELGDDEMEIGMGQHGEAGMAA